MALLLYYYQQQNGIRRERIIKDRLNPLEEFDDAQVKTLLSFEKRNILKLCAALHPNIGHQNYKGAALPTTLQVCLSLNYFATGTFQNQVAKLIRVDQSTASRSIWKFIQGINQNFKNEIKFPTDIEKLKREFFQIAGIPRIIGAIDGSHIPIQRPPLRYFPEEYINRHGTYSINIQATVDLLILTFHGQVQYMILGYFQILI